MRRSCRLLMFVLLAMTLPGAAHGQDAKDLEFFEKKIRPVLVERCYSCHSAEAQKSKKLGGGLLLDTSRGCAKGETVGRCSSSVT